MQRRTFLISGAVVICGAVGYRAASSSDERAIIKVVYKKLHYLRLDDHGVRKFASDIAKIGLISGFRLRVIDAADGLYTQHELSPDGRLGRALRHGEDRVTTQYLLSSDFFVHGFDKSRTIHYLGYYDPMVACNNPFARPVNVAPAA